MALVAYFERLYDWNGKRFQLYIYFIFNQNWITMQLEIFFYNNVTINKRAVSTVRLLLDQPLYQGNKQKVTKNVSLFKTGGVSLDLQRNNSPAGTWRWNDVILTSFQCKCDNVGKWRRNSVRLTSMHLKSKCRRTDVNATWSQYDVIHTWHWNDFRITSFRRHVPTWSVLKKCYSTISCRTDLQTISNSGWSLNSSPSVTNFTRVKFLKTSLIILFIKASSTSSSSIRIKGFLCRRACSSSSLQ